ncbi:MAG: hypothetical protein GPJ52_00765 [Candidatus Heimdallarchaeota archaeon]|nr:hypothetical protein [Candidatus Heimdallarchaeota archaeon]
MSDYWKVILVLISLVVLLVLWVKLVVSDIKRNRERDKLVEELYETIKIPVYGMSLKFDWEISMGKTHDENFKWYYEERKKK